MNKKFSGNYSYTNHNFVFQNMNGAVVDSDIFAVVCILKNILQRGKPTLSSSFLQSHLGAIHKLTEFYAPYALISTRKTDEWINTIRGDDIGDYNPAKQFYYQLIPEYLADYGFIQQLILPEVPINEITQFNAPRFEGQQVDFYLPQAYLVIEIDGAQHNAKEDKSRDAYLLQYGIATVRFSTKEIQAINQDFLTNIQKIKDRIDEVITTQRTRRQSDKSFISLENYRDAYTNGVSLNSPFYTATAIFRFQLLILELLDCGNLKLSEDWVFEIIERDISGFAELAIKDVLIWLEHLFTIQNIDFCKPSFSATTLVSRDEFSSNTKVIRVDFSLLERYTDINLLYPNVIFVRTDYFDEYKLFKKGNGAHIDEQLYQDYDYFKVSTLPPDSSPIRYKMELGEAGCAPSLKYIAWNIFLQSNNYLNESEFEFREGQLSIIANVLSGISTIGLLPTGSGKSICYQLAAILQPALSFVVCPIKSLMFDQKNDLQSAFFTRINHISSDDDAEEKSQIQKEFSSGKYLFIFVSPERFQLKEFRSYFLETRNQYLFSYAVIDEVHCLSEWGHDFRTSYLNLADTIRAYCPNVIFLGLTATASLNVIKDIQTEFDIAPQDTKTPLNYTREELEFIVIDDQGDKFSELKQLLGNLMGTGVFTLNSDGSDKTKCGLIFTPTVNGDYGCYALSQRLTRTFDTSVEYYSGSIPNKLVSTISTRSFDDYKKKVQDDFKANKLSLITATKAFGMGVNKGNIHFTIHYGIPSSMESLYQEAGRAGREKKRFVETKAKCFVLLSKSLQSDDALKQIWNPNASLEEVLHASKGINGDLNTLLFFFCNGLDGIEDESRLVFDFFLKFSKPNKSNVQVRAKELGVTKAKTERAIYRLKQLGVIKDWTVKDFFRGIFDVDFSNYTEESIVEALSDTIKKYDKEFNINLVNTDSKYRAYQEHLNGWAKDFPEIQKTIVILLQWSYDHFAYNRRQSLKNIYEMASKYGNGEPSDKFKSEIENYFRFVESTYILQHIADNPRSWLSWFQTFNSFKDGKPTNEFANAEELQKIKTNLSRFLESYKGNTGFDFISGLLRLLLNDFENSDGRNRFESALKEIQKYPKDEQEQIINETIFIGTKLTSDNKELLAQSLYEQFKERKLLIRLSRELNDSYSGFLLTEELSVKLKQLNGRLYGGL